MERKVVILLLIVGFSVGLTSCGINSSIMLRGTNENVITDVDSIPMLPTEEFRLGVDDMFTIKFLVEDGKRIFDRAAGIGDAGLGGYGRTTSTAFTGGMTYLVRSDGTAELPMLGLIEVAGLSVIELQEKLKSLLSAYYVDPFVQVNVTNRRVIVFRGSAGSASVVALINQNTTLMEALAKAGGITGRGKASKIRIIRHTEQGRKVYQVDLSRIEGLPFADMVLQSHDYIYIEPKRELIRGFLRELGPFMSLISTALTLYSITKIFK